MKKFRYRKVTKEIKKSMQEMWKRKVSYSEIAKETNLSLNTVKYHLDERTRSLTIERAKKSKRKPVDKEKRNAYQREYYKERYNQDPEFRRKIIEANKKSQRKKKLAQNKYFTQDLSKSKHKETE